MSNSSIAQFSTDNEVRWCPGCGDYAILKAMQKYLANSNMSPEKIVFVSGIGCAGRFPYYMNTYGLHVIHGRAPAVATGLKLMRPDLSVWLITGDGDGLSIGANHLIHLFRRNININVLLLNNQIYGLTKGQASPTSPIGLCTKTTPEGHIAEPLNPIKLALAAGSSFVARSLDKDPKHMIEMFHQANEHEGTSFIEILQNCPIFNDGAYSHYDDKKTRNERVIFLKHGSPMQVGKDSYLSKDLNIGNETEQAMIHDKENYQQATTLAELPLNDYPLPLGVYYQNINCNSYNKSIKTISATLDDLNKLSTMF